MITPTIPRGIFYRRSLLLQLLVVCIFTCPSAFAQAPKIQLTEAVLPETQDAIKIAFKVSGASQKRIRVTVAAGGSAVTSDEIKFASDGEHVVSVNLFKGDNTITLIGFVNDDPVDNLVAPLRVKCAGRWCKELFSLKPDTVASEYKEGGGGTGAPGPGGGNPPGQGGPKQETTAQKGDVHINKPKKDVHYVDAGAVQLSVAVDQESDTTKNVKTVFLTVLSDGQPVIQKDNPVKITYPADPKKPGELSTTIKIGKGTNHRIVVFDPTQPDTQRDEVQIVCEGDKCGGAATAASTAQAIRINSPEGGAKLQDAPYVLSKITVKKDSNVTKVFVRVLNNGKPLEKPLVGDGDSLAVAFTGAQTEAVLTPKIRVGKGTNVITVFDADKSIDESPQDSTEITCDGDKCGDVVAAHTGKIVIDLKDGARFVDATFITPKVKIKDAAIRKVYISVLNNDKPIAQTPETSDVRLADDNPVKVRIGPGKNEIKIFDDADKENREQDIVEVFCDGEKCGTGTDIESEATPFTRAIVGLEQAAAASANPEQKLFLEFNLTAPLFRRGGRPIQSPLWLWLNPRITSLPQQTAGSVAEFSTAANFFAPFTSGKVNEIVQGFEFAGGFEVPIPFNKYRVTGPIASGFGSDSRVRFGLSGLLGAGVSAPFSSQKSVQVFKVNQSVIDRFPDAMGKDFIAFVAGDRNRFFRQYFVGLRLKSYYVKASDPDELDAIFPGILDVTFGQNESVTGGELHGGVVKVEGIYPLPFIKGGKKGSFYVFGSALMKLTHPKTIAPIFLQLPDATVTFPAANVLIQQAPTRDSDHYRIGFGVDLIRLLKRNNQ